MLDSRVADRLGQAGLADNTDNVQKLLPHSKIRMFRVRRGAADRVSGRAANVSERHEAGGGLEGGGVKKGTSKEKRKGRKEEKRRGLQEARGIR